MALLALAFTANEAAADDGANVNCVPYDPGLPSVSSSSWPFSE
jgi:hypothetical protein